MSSSSTSAVTSPYRVHVDDPSTSEESPRTDGDLVAVFVLAWLACLLTTLSAFSRGEACEGATTLTPLVVILIPYLLGGWLRSLRLPAGLRRRRR